MKKNRCILIGSISILMLTTTIYSFYDHKPLVSVVMPTYNRLGLLPRAIDSIREQTYDNFEFIIVDDGSTDGSANLLASYAQIDKRIKILTNPTNKGISYSRNRGTDAAKGKYVAIMDSDDYSLPTRLEKHVKYLEENSDVIALTALYHEMGKAKNETNNWVPPQRFNIIFHFKNYFTNISFFRKDFIKKHNIRYNENLISSEDYDFWAQIFMKGGKFAILNEHLFNLRRHRTNPKKYYKEIKLNARKTSDKLLRFSGVENPEKYSTDCERLHALVEAQTEKEKNKNSKTKKPTQPIDLYALNLTYNRNCKNYKSSQHAFYIKHTDFIDYFDRTDKKDIFKRHKDGKIYQLIEEKENKIFTFKNEDLITEIYHIQRDGSLTIKEIIRPSFYEKMKHYILNWL